MNENPKPKCTRCGAELPDSDVCPRCAAEFLQATQSAGPEGRHAFVAPSSADLAARFPQLEILAFIGQGGMGAVYRARQRELDRVVALKILPPDMGDQPGFSERFIREAKAMAKLNHPGIVTIHDFGRADGLFYFLMEFVDGVSLSQLIDGGRVSPREALAIVPQICDALQYAHDQGIVHRDIKPENVLLDRRGRVKVADFGLARLMEGGPEPLSHEGADSNGLSEAGKVLGTPRYMAPEQAECPAGVDHRADIYALGVVFYQMLTGKLPGKPVEPPSKNVRVDVRLDEVVLRALAKEPERRYQQASHLKTAVESVSSEGGPREAAASSGLRQILHAPGQARRMVVGGVLALLAFAVLAVVAVGLLVLEARRSEQGSRAELSAGEAAQHLVASAPTQVLAIPARKGDLRVYLNSLGTVASSNTIEFSIPQDYVQEVVRKLDSGKPIAVEAYNRSYTSKFGHGFLVGVDNQIDTATGTLKCKASFVPEDSNLMVPGFYLNIRMLLETRPGVIQVPSEAIEHGPDSAFVWVIKADHTVSRRPVQIGAVEDEEPANQPGAEEGAPLFRRWTEVQAGLEPGELVVARGRKSLVEGGKVTHELINRSDEVEPGG